MPRPPPRQALAELNSNLTYGCGSQQEVTLSDWTFGAATRTWVVGAYPDSDNPAHYDHRIPIMQWNCWCDAAP
jgi:hypothetical protein